MNLGHIGLNVSNLERSVQFYSELLGFTVRKLSNDLERKFALLGDDHKNLITLWQQSRGEFSPSDPGLHHLAFQVDSVEAIQEYETKLKANHVPFIYDGMVAHSEGADSGGIYFTDPDGIRLEIYAMAGMAEAHQCKTNGPACGFF